jgi:hypothetical protein
MSSNKEVQLEARTSRDEIADSRQVGLARRLATETKQAFKTTEFWIYVVILIGLFIAGAVADANESATTTADEGGFGPERVWLYAVILTVGYMISRGLAKAGSRDPYWDVRSQGDGAPLTERVKTAAQVLKDGDETHTGSPGTRR